MINQTTLCGNMTRDPEYKVTAGGFQIMEFGIAVNERHKNNQTGEWEDKANFFDLRVYGSRAEKLANILHKGMKVAVSGRLRYEAGQDKATGQNRSRVVVIVNDLEFMTKGDGAKKAEPALYAEDIPF